jgi:hypothetical protein
MSGNTNFRSGSVSYASKDKQMAAYDKLPPTIRQALANAAFNWASYPLHQRFQRGSRTAKEWAKLIAKWDADQIAKDRTRVWGIEPEPRGSRHGRRA